jgi:hypothetical protein
VFCGTVSKLGICKELKLMLIYIQFQLIFNAQRKGSVDAVDP